MTAWRRDRGQPGQVGWIAGQDPVTGPGQEHDGGIDRISPACRGQQHARRAAVWLSYGADVDRAQQPRQA
jgi:hypothetical protein